MSSTIKMKVVKNLYQNGSFCILGCKPLGNYSEHIKLNKYGTFTLKGDLSFMFVGKEYEVQIEECSNSSKYGVSYTLVRMKDEEEVMEFTDETELAALNTITTPAQARYVHEAYPNFIRLVLAGRTNEIDVKNIYNVKEFRFNAYVKQIKEQYKYVLFKMAIKEFDVSLKEARILSQKYQTIDAVNQVFMDNPYKIFLEDLKRDIGEADHIILEKRPELYDSDIRTEYILASTIENYEEETSSTRMNANEMALKCKDYISTNKYQNLKQFVIDNEKFYYDEPTNTIALMHTYLAECSIAEKVIELLSKPKDYKINWQQYAQNDEYTLTDEQQQLLRLASEQNICILQGSAGSGKTSAVRSLITMLDNTWLTYSLMAPTGIAAKRLRETTGRKAVTIHKALLDPKTNPFEADYVIIDEFSMVGVGIASSIMSKMGANTKLILICDVAQLPSISCGNVLQDMLDSGLIPTVTLTKIFRYGKGSLTTVATDIRRGKQYVDADGSPIYTGAEQDSDYTFIPLNEEPLNQVMEEYKKLTNKYGIANTMVLSPYNVGNLGCDKINEAIQSEYNSAIPDERSVKYLKTIFRVKDKVINTKNDYEAVTEEKFRAEQIEQSLLQDDSMIETAEMQHTENIPYAQVMNGDIGYIRSIDENNNIFIQFDEQVIVFDYSKLGRLKLGYAISIHKSQGSQAKAVLIITSSQHKKNMNKNLLYVGCTRSQEKLVQIGEVSAINEALGINETRIRNTFLKDLLLEKNSKNFS